MTAAALPTFLPDAACKMVSMDKRILA